MYKYIDIHSHLDFKDYDLDRQETIKRMETNKVATISIGVDGATSGKAVELAIHNENIWACVGCHPTESIQDFDLIEELALNKKVVAIGECGLDYGREGNLGDEEKKKQKDLFLKHIDLAKRLSKPLMIHCRNAYDDLIDILKSQNEVKGNAHFFSGNIEQAKKLLDLGFTFSFTGVITFTKDYDEVIKWLPIDKIMAETDSPFVAPVPQRGKRNEPVFVEEVYKAIANIKGLELEDVISSIRTNVEKTFGF